MNASESVRTFVAIELHPALREAIGVLQSQLAPGLAGIRMVRPEGIHLTLRFLGTTSPAQLAQLRPMLAKAAALCGPGAARVLRLGTFPDRGSPRVLWLGIDVPPQFADLQRACERAARVIGFAPEERAFRPHLTLGRWRDRTRIPELPVADLGETRLEKLVVFASELRRDGAVYTPLDAFALTGE